MDIGQGRTKSRRSLLYRQVIIPRGPTRCADSSIYHRGLFQKPAEKFNWAGKGCAAHSVISTGFSAELQACWWMHQFIILLYILHIQLGLISNKHATPTPGVESFSGEMQGRNPIHLLLKSKMLRMVWTWSSTEGFKTWRSLVIFTLPLGFCLAAGHKQ